MSTFFAYTAPSAPINCLNSASLEQELQRNHGLRREDVASLREWYDKQLRLPKLSDGDLALFLNSAYFKVEPAKRRIESYFTTRSQQPEIFSDRMVLVMLPSRQEVFKKICIVPLDKRTREGYKVILIKLLDPEVSSSFYNDAAKYFHLVLDLCVHEDGTASDYVMVLDANGADLKRSKFFSLADLQRFLDYVQGGMPVRWKALHYVDTAAAAATVDLGAFVKSRIVYNDYVEVLHFHSDLESLNEMVPQRVLPSEMGGAAGPLMDLHQAELNRLQRRMFWFCSMECKTKVKENLRGPGAVESSLAKLQISS